MTASPGEAVVFTRTQPVDSSMIVARMKRASTPVALACSRIAAFIWAISSSELFSTFWEAHDTAMTGLLFAHICSNDAHWSIVGQPEVAVPSPEYFLYETFVEETTPVSAEPLAVLVELAVDAGLDGLDDLDDGLDDLDDGLDDGLADGLADGLTDVWTGGGAWTDDGSDAVWAGGGACWTDDVLGSFLWCERIEVVRAGTGCSTVEVAAAKAVIEVTVARAGTDSTVAVVTAKAALDGFQ